MLGKTGRRTATHQAAECRKCLQNDFPVRSNNLVLHTQARVDCLTCHRFLRRNKGFNNLSCSIKTLTSNSCDLRVEKMGPGQSFCESDLHQFFKMTAWFVAWNRFWHGQNASIAQGLGYVSRSGPLRGGEAQRRLWMWHWPSSSYMTFGHSTGLGN